MDGDAARLLQVVPFPLQVGQVLVLVPLQIVHVAFMFRSQPSTQYGLLQAPEPLPLQPEQVGRAIVDCGSCPENSCWCRRFLA